MERTVAGVQEGGRREYQEPSDTEIPLTPVLEDMGSNQMKQYGRLSAQRGFQLQKLSETVTLKRTGMPEEVCILWMRLELWNDV